MKSDIEIARETQGLPITVLAQNLGLNLEEIKTYGSDKAKVIFQSLEKRLEKNKEGNLILVTAISPTKAGEGKSTTSIGLADAMTALGKNTMLCLREPSMGPVFGIKGGAAGGGYAQVIPMEDINLHFTGDLHAITAANNLISAVIDNHLYWGNDLQIDPNQILWKRCMDCNDRTLRSLTVGKGYKKDTCVREDGFNITVASEIMAILCLAESMEDLEQRLNRIKLAYTYSGKAIYLRDLDLAPALCVVLKDALLPNLVQTLEKTPAFVHGGPFANIAHGCSSVIATKTALKLSDYVITEAGFGADLGAEKFLDIKCRLANLDPKAVVIVASIRALKLHGGINEKALDIENVEALIEGTANLQKHIETLQFFGLPYLVAINQFPSDTEAEVQALKEWCKTHGHPMEISEVFSKGSKGGLDLAKSLLDILERNNHQRYTPLYELHDSFEEKILKIAQKAYGAESISLSESAKLSLEKLKEEAQDLLPLCVAKTPASLSDDPKLFGAPKGFNIHIREIRPSLGAGFLVCLTGDVMTMPGLPKKPKAMSIFMKDNQIFGLD